MSSRIVYSPQALQELDQIWEYIRYDLSNPSAADRIINGVLDRIDTLEQYPESGARWILTGDMDSGYRYVVFEEYVAFYRLQEVATQSGEEMDRIIYIDHVVYSRRDYMRLLFPQL